MSAASIFLLPRQSEICIARRISRNDLKAINVVFLECDEGKKGFLSKEDLKVAMVSLFGYKPSKYETEKLLESVKSKRPDGDIRPEGIELKEFIDAMSKKIAVKDRDEEIRQMFLAFDTQCRGFLTIDDLRKVAAHVAPNISLPTLETAFREADRDGDGRVSFKDFEFIMRYNEDVIS